MTESQMFSVHKQVDLIWCISKHLWGPAHSSFFFFFVCCRCSQEARNFFSLYFSLQYLLPPLPPSQRPKSRWNCWKIPFCWEKYSSLLRTLVELEAKHLLSFLQASSPLSTTSVHLMEMEAVASPAWWTWRCGGTLRAPPVWQGPSGRSGCRLWRTPVLGSAEHTVLCWSFMFEAIDFFYIMNSKCGRFYGIGSCEHRPAQSASVSPPWWLSRVQRGIISSKLGGSEVSSLLPHTHTHTYTLCVWCVNELFDTFPRASSLARGEMTWNGLILPGILSPLPPSLPGTCSNWTLHSKEFELLLLLLCVEQTHEQHESWTRVPTRKPVDQPARANIPNVEFSSQTDGCSVMLTGSLLLSPWWQYDIVDRQGSDGGKWTPVRVTFLIRCCSVCPLNMHTDIINMHIFII